MDPLSKAMHKSEWVSKADILTEQDKPSDVYKY